MDAQPAFLAAFNAKTMTFDEVARTFCPSSKYEELAGDWHALLIGPRGSGKTTLMKMLSLQGLNAWPSGSRVPKPLIGYTGIYVPADIAWSEMVRALTMDSTDPETGGVVAEAAFVTNVLLSAVRTIEFGLSTAHQSEESIFRRFDVGGAAHDEWIRHVATLWKVTPSAISVRSLTRALEARIINLRREVRLLDVRQRNDMSVIRERMPYVGLPLIETVAQTLLSFNQALGTPDHKWALLLDEFEVAPLSLQSTVLRVLRAGVPELLLKVALAPSGPHTGVLDDSNLTATQRNDFRQVLLWYPDPKHAQQFCEDVCRGWLKRGAPGLADVPLPVLFGTSLYTDDDAESEPETDSDPSNRKRRLKELSRWFNQLAEGDPSFAEFLARRGIDPNRLEDADKSYARHTIRKIAPIVAFRAAYRGEKGRVRGRKPYGSSYVGWNTLAAMSEGNPRWLIGMLISIWASSRWKGDSVPVPNTIQIDAMRETGGAFVEMLRSLATGRRAADQSSEPVLDVIEKIAEYARQRLVVDSFSEDPPMVFEVDDAVSSAVEQALRLGLNHGAIVFFDPPDRAGGYESLRGREFRIAYLLAQQFKLPIRKSKKVSLSTALAPPVLPLPQFEVERVTSRLTATLPSKASQGKLEW